MCRAGLKRRSIVPIFWNGLDWPGIYWLALGLLNTYYIHTYLCSGQPGGTLKLL